MLITDEESSTEQGEYTDDEDRQYYEKKMK